MLPQPPLVKEPVSDVRIDLPKDFRPLQLDKDLLLGFITSEGSTESHTTILARTMGVPAVIRFPELLESHDGELVIVDGTTGNVVFNPDENDISQGAEETL